MISRIAFAGLASAHFGPRGASRPGTVLLVLPFFLAACASSGEMTASPMPAPGESIEIPTVEAEAEAIEGYVLGQGDRIGIQVFDEPDLTMESRVGASGRINYSYLGDIRVEGKTAQQIERDITRLLEDGYLVNPSVNVTVVEYRPFFINGEVRAPGSYPYQPGLTLDKAIALAGGLTDRASARRISVLKARDGEVKGRMNTEIDPGDIISIEEGFF